MQLTIIDNSTITAVQRLAGTAPTRSTKNTDGDIAALETFIQSLLFSDLVCSVDDYKSQYREARKNEFPFVHQLNIPDLDLKAVSRQVQRDIQALDRTISEGKIEGELARVLTSLGVLTHCAWEMSNSTFWLQLYLISNPDVDSSSMTLSQVLAGLNDTTYNNDFFWSENVNIKTHSQTGALTSGFRALIAAMSWLIGRVRFYESAANSVPASLALHPVRHGYLAYRIWQDANVSDHLKTRLLGLLGSNAIKSIATSVTLEPEYVDLPLPFFTAWLANQRADVPSMIQLALELKVDSDFRAFRRYISVIDNDSKGLKNVKGIEEDIRRSVDRFMGKYSVRGLNPTGTAIFKLADSATKLPLSSFLGLLESLGNFEKEVASGMGLFRRIAHDLTEIPRWGALRDQLGKDVMLDEKAVYDPKEIAPNELDRILSFRKPMT